MEYTHTHTHLKILQIKTTLQVMAQYLFIYIYIRQGTYKMPKRHTFEKYFARMNLKSKHKHTHNKH